MKFLFILLLLLVLYINMQSLYNYYLTPLTYCNNTGSIFEDFISVDVATQSDQTDLSKEWNSNELELLISLESALKSLPIMKPVVPNVIHKSDTRYNVSLLEIENSVQAALALKQSGKTEKALKVIKYAAAVAPTNPDILNYYGEILEDSQKDIITADQLYHKALIYCPDHKGALINRHRTAHIVEQMDLKIFQTIDEKRDMLKKIPENDEAFKKFKKQAYYLHIHHTVGIEGNTLSIEQLRYLLETGKAVFGKSVIEHNEILGLQLAMKYVKLLSRVGRITTTEILGIHRRVMGYIDPISSGTFRDTQVYVGNHIPPNPNDVAPLIEELVEWLNSEEAANMHPVRYAALAHYKLVEIHPFFDGNGRTSRLLMNLILIRASYPPVIILKEHRRQYYDYLKLANKGDIRPFVRFIAQCTEQVLDLYLWGVQQFSEITNLEGDSKHTISINLGST